MSATDTPETDNQEFMANLMYDSPVVDADFARILERERDEARAAMQWDLDDMLGKCIPGGCSCDPQKVADDIRDYFRGLMPLPPNPNNQDNE